MIVRVNLFQVVCEYLVDQAESIPGIDQLRQLSFIESDYRHAACNSFEKLTFEDKRKVDEVFGVAYWTNSESSEERS